MNPIAALDQQSPQLQPFQLLLLGIFLTAYLTAVDTSLNHALSPVDRDNERVSVSLDELTRVIRLWREQQGDTAENPYRSLFQYVHPLVIGAVDRAESLSLMLCRELLAYHIDDAAQAEAIASALNGKYPSHNYPILLDEAVKIFQTSSRVSPGRSVNWGRTRASRPDAPWSACTTERGKRCSRSSTRWLVLLLL